MTGISLHISTNILMYIVHACLNDLRLTAHGCEVRGRRRRNNIVIVYNMIINIIIIIIVKFQ